MSHHFDVIVAGVGGVGSAALYHLAARGIRVLGIDRFEPGHAHGSSHGETRVIRKAYFEHADYVPLLERAYVNWFELERQAGERLFFQPGLIEIGPPDGELIQGVTQAAKQYQLPLESIERQDFLRRFPGFRLPADSVAIFEPQAGYLLVERCVMAYTRLAQQAGAMLHTGEAVLGWTSENGTVKVVTQTQTYTAANLVISAGAWASQLLMGLGVQLPVLRKHLHWYATTSASAYVDSPVFFYETPDGYYYGFPQLGDDGVKVAEHSGGEPVEDPSYLNRQMDPAERARVESFVRQYLPAVSLNHTRHETCMYTMTRDQHFIVDRHPEFPNVAFAAGLSGHGFKFASVLGEMLADLALQATMPAAAQFLSVQRLLPSDA